MASTSARLDDVSLSLLPPHLSLPPQSSREEFLQCGVPLYQAALEGNWASAEQILKQSPDWIRKPIAKGGERILHIAAAAKQTQFVKNLVELMSVNDLELPNNVQNTALCLAATSGVVEIAQVMVNKNANLPNIRGSQRMMPVLMAVLLGQRKMAWYLLEVTDDYQLEDCDRVNILTSSIDTDLFDVAIYIIKKHPKLAVLRNQKQETALHVLAQKPLKSRGYDEKRTWKMLMKLGGSLAQRKSLSEPPLELQLVQSLWQEVIKEEEKTVSKIIGYPWRLLFAAAKCGNEEFLITLIRSYPDLVWKVDEENRSIFHIAIINRHEEIFKLIHEVGAIKDLIAVDKDSKNNNMLHLAGTLPSPERLNCVSGAALQMQRELLWFKAVEKIVRPEYAKAKNEDNQTPQALFTQQHEKLRAKGEEWMKKTAESCALVASLIATMVFSAAFQLPGGINSETGGPILVNQPLFIAFAVCNALSLFSSSASILTFLSILTSRYAEHDFLKSLPLKLMVGLSALFVSIATMVAAFMATFFITFREGGRRWIPMPMAVFGPIPIFLFAFQHFPLLIEIYHSTYRSQSLFQPRQQKLFRNYSTIKGLHEK